MSSRSRSSTLICEWSCGLLLLIGCAVNSYAQGSAGTEGRIQPRYLVDIPTAGLLDRGSFALDANFFQAGGLVLGLMAGPLDRLNFGISYGGTAIIGSDEPVWNRLPGVNIRFRIFDESNLIPAIAIGFDSQGKENYIESLERYTIKSPGFYVAGSKNYELLGHLSLHGGINYSMERADGDKDMNVFVGVEKTIGGEISVMLEHDFGFNDSNSEAPGKGRGYMNFGTRWSIGYGFTLGVDLKDIIKNQQHVTIGKRIIRFEYIRSF